MPRISANGIQVYYELRGPENAPVVALSNGMLMTVSSWALQRRVLSRRYRLLLYDLRGQGESDHPLGAFSLEQHADDLAALLTALDIRRAHVGGVSYGAEISLAFALRFPDRTRSLIAAMAASQVDPMLRGIVEAWGDAARARDPDRLWGLVTPLTFSEPWLALNREAVEMGRTRYHALDFDSLLQVLDAFLAMNLTPHLHTVDAPALVIHAEDDLLKPRKYAEILIREMPHAEFLILPHAGHAAQWEQAEAFNTAVLGFLDKQGDEPRVG